MFTYILMFTHLYSHVKNRHLYGQEPIFSCMFDKNTYKSGLVFQLKGKILFLFFNVKNINFISKSF